MPKREEVYKAIDGERKFQNELWPSSDKLSTTGEITLLRKYLTDFEHHYADEGDAPGLDAPTKCYHDIRKMAAILIRAMENHLAPERVSTNAT